MSYKNLEGAFKNRIPNAEGYSRPSAVLIPIIEINNEPHLLLTQRALNMKHQPGDFCFPGGGCEGDETPEETAIRETWEELGIPQDKIKIIGPTDFIATPFGAYVKPFVGILENFDLDEININKDEVDFQLHNTDSSRYRRNPSWLQQSSAYSSSWHCSSHS